MMNIAACPNSQIHYFVGKSLHLNLVEKVLITSITIFLKELHHYLAHIDLLLHHSKYGSILLTGLHQDVIGKS